MVDVQEPGTEEASHDNWNVPVNGDDGKEDGPNQLISDRPLFFS